VMGRLYVIASIKFTIQAMFINEVTSPVYEYH
jgi:hypothetical protein